MKEQSGYLPLFSEKPKQAAPILLAASLAENLHGKKVLFL